MKKLLYIHLFLFLSITVYSQNKIVLSTVQTVGRNVIAGEEISLTPGFSFTSNASKSMSLQVDISTYQIVQSAVADPNANKALAASTNQNYILTRTYMQDDAQRFLDQVQYFDGLGRPTETVQRGISPLGKDLISFQEYDGFGRESNAWLPVAIAANNGAYADLTKVKSNISASYPSEANPHSKPVYESSPLNRILEQYGPGADWHSKGKRVRTEYLTNTASGVQSCIYFSVTGTLLATAIKKNANYAVNQLYVTKMTDEDENVSYEFKDKLGQVVLTRQMLGTTQHDTYYVYDDFGNLSYVLPPKAGDEVINFADNDAKMRQLAYLYKYDERNRCTKKRLPSTAENNTDVNSGWIFYIYDKADQLILSQDGEQRKKGEWAFNKYDAFGRIIISGMHKTADSHTALIAKCQNIVVKEIMSGSSYGYSWSCLPEILSSSALVVNHYDDYDHLLNRSPNFRSKLDYIEKADYGKRYIHAGLGMKTPKGSLVGTRVRLMQPNGTISGEIVTAMYYDNRGRLIQTKSINHLDGVEEEYIAYNFTGQPIKKMHAHTAPGKSTQIELYGYSYDHAGRLLDTKHKWNNGAETIVATNTYDELGRLKTNKKGNNANLNTTYEYNVRSWTTKMSSPLFTQNLFYNTSPIGFANKAQYGGNISAISWTVKGDTERKYGFTYDNLSRLTHSAYNFVTSGGQFSTSYTYDKHGNMMNMVQNGLRAAGSYGQVDNLGMSYSGNQLINIHNAGTGSNVSETHAHFRDYSKDAAKTKVEYAYNANGAMTQDLNKGISTIQYNSLNLPRQMDIKSPVAEARNEYTYSASGQKLRVVSKWNTTYNKAPIIGSAVNASLLNKSETTDYVGNKIYENGVLKRILIDGGYIEASKYHYYQTDHLGNNRVVADNTGAIVQSTHYYPFGMAFAEGTGEGKQPYKYNGKELDAQHGLNTYDYSARYMDPGIGRFTSVDPLAEKYYSWSPYVYVMNNPINAVDLRGDSITIIDEQSILAIYHGLASGSNVTMKFNNGVLDPTSIKDQAQNSSDFFLQDLYEIATHKTMVELTTSENNKYVMNNEIVTEPFTTPADDNSADYGAHYESILKNAGEPTGRSIVGNLGQTLIPGNISASGKSSTNKNIQVIINKKGSINHQSVGIAHEFGHVLLYLRNKPYGHGQPGVDKFVYDRATKMSKRLGYDF